MIYYVHTLNISMWYSSHWWNEETLFHLRHMDFDLVTLSHEWIKFSFPLNRKSIFSRSPSCCQTNHFSQILDLFLTSIDETVALMDDWIQKHETGLKKHLKYWQVTSDHDGNDEHHWAWNMRQRRGCSSVKYLWKRTLDLAALFSMFAFTLWILGFKNKVSV